MLYSINAPINKNRLLSISDDGATREALTKDDIEKFEIFIPLPSIQRRIADILSAYDELIEVNQQRIRLLEDTARQLYREWFVRLRFPGWKEERMVKGVPEGWEVKRLDDVIELAYGKALKEEGRVDGEHPVYGSSGVVGFHNVSIVRGPGIIVGRKGNVGSVLWSNVDFYPIDTVFFVKRKTDIPLEYLFFNLQDQHFIEGDAAVPGLSRNQAYKNYLLIPAKGILQRFAALVVPIFQQIETLQQQNTHLRQIRDRLLPRLVSGKLAVGEVENIL